MALSQYIDNVAELMASKTSKGFSIKCISQTSYNSRIIDKEKMATLAKEDARAVRRIAQQCPEINIFPLYDRDYRRIILAVLCQVDRRWWPALLKKDSYSVDHNGKRVEILKENITQLSVNIKRKLVYNYQELAAGLMLNTIIDKVPAFVYTFGAENHSPLNSSKQRKNKNISQPFFLLTEMVSGGIPMSEWLKSERNEYDIYFVFFQILGNLVAAKDLINFTCGDLLADHVIIRETSSCYVPIRGKLGKYSGRFEAKITNYNLANFSNDGIMYAAYSNNPSNFRDVWTDVIKLLLTSIFYSEKTNREILSSLFYNTFSIKGGTIEEYMDIMYHLYYTALPNKSMYANLADIKSVLDTMAITLDNSLLEIGTVIPFRTSPHITKEAQMALGLTKDDNMLRDLLDKTMHDIEISIASILDIQNSEMDNSAEDLLTLHEYFSLAEFVACQIGNFSSYSMRARDLRKSYERLFSV